ncbi:exodeoxyribonuclease V subunit beta [Pseudomonas oligotrophica]|uniref:exodeoxyribonuclease V subunit beta n=1 Tax=Pseudomonas oligotrophica TaxID=2912055 RepID=UPI001F00F4DC|nr:exodeoxyribonuclease V subunit beta [Pseudomonas oligotrophica]MCF7201249.1 exodeoxyribonuclease V subunit beta [Pseudomonas oligotrophica]
MTFNLLTDSFSGRTLIEASAGTGKTWTLTALYARLLLERQLSVGQILVVTYTKAATAELRERIRTRLAELLAVYDGQPSDDALLNELHARFPGEEARRRLLLAVHGFDEAAIFTIHGFCQRALQDAAFEAGGDFDSELTQDDREVLDALLADAWRHELAAADPAWARFLAKAGITPATLRQSLRSHLGKPYLRVEPAEPPPAADLGAVDAAWQRAAQCWHAAGAAWVTELRAHGGLSQSTHKVAKLDGWQAQLDAYFADPAALLEAPEALAKLGAAAIAKACKKGHATPLCALAEALDELNEALSQVLPAGQQRLVALQVRLLQQLDRELPARKAAQRLLAFDDLLNCLDQALTGEGGEQLAETLRTQYPLALIDEFQDTDPIQYAIFSRIYPAGQVGADLCFVGDPKQAIYGFRGADLATYLQAKRQVDRPPYTLPVNHRSTPQLIDALNRLFDRPRPFAAADPDYLPVAAAQRPRPRLRLPDSGAPLSLVWLGEENLSKGRAGERAAVDTARRIATLLAAAARGEAGFEEDQGLRPLKGGDIAVLVANHRQAGLVAEQLARRGVPSVRRGRDSVWQSEEAAELAAVLAAYAEPGREGLLRYALATRLLGRSAADLARCQDEQREWDREREAAERYHQLWQQQGFLRLFRSWLDEQGVAARLLERVDGERRLTNLLHLGELLQTQSLGQPGLEPLLAWFAEQRSGEGAAEDALLRLESDAERVQIVTIHTSKGLEYPLVFCPFLWDGKLLGRNTASARCHDEHGRPLLDLGSAQLDEHLEQARREVFAEQLRLVYVALTRPRDRLWVHWGPVCLCQPKKDGSYADEGLHTSAMAWLLHGRGCPGEDALAELAGHLGGLDEAALVGELDALVAASAGTLARLPLEEEATGTLGESRAEPPRALAQLSRNLHSAWRIGSFSGLAAGLHMEAPDRDALALPDASEPGAGFFAFPRGARAGTCLHAILEDWARGKAPLAELVEPALAGHGLSTDWTESARAQLQQVLDTDLDGHGLRLAALRPERRLPELGFTFPVQDLEVTRLRALLGDPASGLPAPLREAAARLEFDTLRGFLKGFIDLTFEHDGRWYILDYKSNWLGPDASYYGGERLLQALAGEHYYLQYLIYLVALRRFLRQRLLDYRDDCLGGAYYLFLRGMPAAGVYFARPDDALLDALDRLFAEGR